MSWYAQTPALRSRQLTADAAVAARVLLWAWLGTVVHRAVSRLAAPAASWRTPAPG